MTELKERLSAELQHAKQEGNLRASRVREIVQVAVSQVMKELKGGSIEIRAIVQDVLAVVLGVAKDKGTSLKDEIAPTITSAIDGLVSALSEARAAGNTVEPQTIDVGSEASASPVTDSSFARQEQQLEADVDQLLMEIEASEVALSELDASERDASESDAAVSSTQSQDVSETAATTAFRQQVQAAIDAIRQQQLPRLQQQYLRLQQRLAELDVQLADRYGDRYEIVKQRLESLKTWYDTTKASIEAGEPTPLEQQQVVMQRNATKVGATLAQKEQQVLVRVRHWLQALVQQFQQVWKNYAAK